MHFLCMWMGARMEDVAIVTGMRVTHLVAVYRHKIVDRPYHASYKVLHGNVWSVHCYSICTGSLKGPSAFVTYIIIHTCVIPNLLCTQPSPKFQSSLMHDQVHPLCIPCICLVYSVGWQYTKDNNDNVNRTLCSRNVTHSPLQQWFLWTPPTILTTYTTRAIATVVACT